MSRTNSLIKLKNKSQNSDFMVDRIKSLLFSPDYFARMERIGAKSEKFKENPRELLWQECLAIKSKYISPLFDYDFYLTQLKEDLSKKDPIHAILHYITNARKNKNLKPHILFDTKFYLSNNPAIKENPLFDYILREKEDEVNPHRLFNTSFYYENYKNVKDSDFSALQHYIEFGYNERKNPNPLFKTIFIKRYYSIPDEINPLASYLNGNPYKINKTCEIFDGEFFLSKNDGILNDHRNQTPLELFYEKSENQLLVTSKKLDPKLYLEKYDEIEIHPALDYIQNKTDRSIELYLSKEIYEQVDLAVKIEPRVKRHHLQMIGQMQYSLPFHSPAYGLLSKCLDIVGNKYDIFILLSTMRSGGAELFTCKIINSILNNSKSKILLIYTDKVKVEAPERVPEADNLDLLDFEELAPNTNEEDRHKVLMHLISSYRPTHILNTNSFFGWNMYLRYGKSLAQITKLDTCLFCYDYDIYGKKSGYPVDYLVECHKYLNTIITDNTGFKNEVKEDFGYAEEDMKKFHVLHQPPDKSLTKINRDSLVDKIRNNNYNRRPTFIWASRISKQKRPDILISIADRLPKVDFELWGQGDITSYLPESVSELPENIILKQGFGELREINYVNSIGFIHTCEWDGLPTMVLDMLNLGLPVVAPDIGGISNLVNTETGWLIDDFEDIDAYCNAIREILSKPDLVEEKLSKAQARILAIHDNSIFDSVLQEKLAYYHG